MVVSSFVSVVPVVTVLGGFVEDHNVTVDGGIELYVDTKVVVDQAVLVSGGSELVEMVTVETATMELAVIEVVRVEVDMVEELVVAAGAIGWGS